jgi:hypothetical protein
MKSGRIRLVGKVEHMGDFRNVSKMSVTEPEGNIS